MATNQVNTFTFEGKAPVRIVMQGEEPWFVAADVAGVLEHRDANTATRILDEDEKGTQIVRTPSGDQQVTVISESGLYTLILRSRKPQARPFRRWVTHEVLPALRREGTYSVPKVAQGPKGGEDTWITAREAGRKLGISAAQVWKMIPQDSRYIDTRSHVHYVIWEQLLKAHDRNTLPYRGQIRRFQDELQPTPLWRVRFARAAVAGYRKARSLEDPKQTASDLICLLADLMHLSSLDCLNWTDLVEAAKTRYRGHVEEPAPRPRLRRTAH